MNSMWNFLKKRWLLRKVIFVSILALFYVATSHAQYAYRIVPVTALPATCLPANGSVVALVSGTGSVGIYHCQALNTWTAIGTVSGSITLPATGGFGWTSGLTLKSAANSRAFFAISTPTDMTRFTFGPEDTYHAAIGVTAALAGQTQGIIILKGDGSTAVFSDLGAATNGSMIYCSDCTIASPCNSGGSGALAKRLNGSWVCN